MALDRGKTCFVTGASGFFGRRFLEAVARRHPTLRLRLLAHRRPIPDPPPNAEQVSGSLEDRAGLRRLLEGVDSVVHFAAVTHASRPEAYFGVNTVGTRNLAQAAREAGVGRLVFISSRAARAACGDYGLSKLQAEEAVRGSGVPYVILRFSEVYGPGSSEGLNALLALVRRAPLVPYPAGSFTLAPLFLEDAMLPILEVLERPEVRDRVYTIAGPGTYSLREIIRIGCGVFGVTRLRLPVPLGLISVLARLSRILGREIVRYDQIDRLTCEKDSDIESARRELGFSPIPLEAGLLRLRAET